MLLNHIRQLVPSPRPSPFSSVLHTNQPSVSMPFRWHRTVANPSDIFPTMKRSLMLCLGWRSRAQCPANCKPHNTYPLTGYLPQQYSHQYTCYAIDGVHQHLSLLLNGEVSQSTLHCVHRPLKTSQNLQPQLYCDSRLDCFCHQNSILYRTVKFTCTLNEWSATFYEDGTA